MDKTNYNELSSSSGPNDKFIENKNIKFIVASIYKDIFLGIIIICLANNSLSSADHLQ